MQHHQHVTRAPNVAAAPHLRTHHIPTMHTNNNAVNIGPALNLPQQSQQPTHQIANVPSQAAPAPVAGVAVTNITKPSAPQAPHIHDPHNRLQYPQTHHNNGGHLLNGRSSTQQMHKGRQQNHQINNNYNKQLAVASGGGGAGGGGVPYQQPLAPYNHINAPHQINHMGVASQQQRNVIYHPPNPNQPPHPPQHHPHQGPLPPPAQQQQHLKNSLQQHNVIPPQPPPSHLTKQLQHQPPPPLPPPLAPTINPSYYKHNNNSNKLHKYSNNNGYAYGGKNVPKHILQNSNNCHTKSSNNMAAANASATATTTTVAHQINGSMDHSNPPMANSTHRDDSNDSSLSRTNGNHLENLAGSLGGSGTSNNLQSLNGNDLMIDSSDDKENEPMPNDHSEMAYNSLNENINNNNNNINNNFISNDNNKNDSSNLSSSSSSNNINIIINNNNNKGGGNCNNILSNEDLSASKNSKEKTPMCLVNELARFNKITHQYRLTNEKGPAHCKRFTVTLKLGDEEYTAEGYKIKKAQHLAAAEAIEKTKYKHPVPKANRRNEEGGSGRTNITPTVELNALAMKLGQQTYYLFDPRQMGPTDNLNVPPEIVMPFLHPSQMPPPPPLPAHPHHQMMDPMYIRRTGSGYVTTVQMTQHRYMTNGISRGGAFPHKFSHRYPMPMSHMSPQTPGAPGHPGSYPPGPPTSCKITLIVGKQKFVGIGRNLQQAKHDAAARALQVLKNQANEQANNELNNSLQDSDSKSPISMVHEIGLKRNMPVNFKVVREEGPAHMKNFITACIVGNIVTEGEGNGKKISKKRSAEKMLEELKKLPPLTPTKSPLKRIKVKTPGKVAMTPGVKPVRRRANTASIKEKTQDETEDDNPVSRLIQIQQSRKEKEPVFELISKNANEKSRRREFIMEVTIQGMVARGTGTNKKMAKRNAAMNLLMAMGLDGENHEQETDEAFNTSNTSNADSNTSMNIHNVSASSANPSSSGVSEMSDVPQVNPLFSEMDVPLISTTAGQVPGILLVRQSRKNASKKKEHHQQQQQTHQLQPQQQVPQGMQNQQHLQQQHQPQQVHQHQQVQQHQHHQQQQHQQQQQQLQQSQQQHQPQETVPTQLTEQKGVPVSEDLQTVAPLSKEAAVDCSPEITRTAAVPEPIQSEGHNGVPENKSTERCTSSSNSSSDTSSDHSSSTNSSSNKNSGGVHMKDQLLYLSKLLGFEVQFSNYPKGNHKEFLTIVTLSSDPPQICHGVGANSEQSENDAAKNALKILSELGLNSSN